jgi:hypothetical protein
LTISRVSEAGCIWIRLHSLATTGKDKSDKESPRDPVVKNLQNFILISPHE